MDARGRRQHVPSSCARCQGPSEKALCEPCLRYLWLFEPLRFDVRVAAGPAFQEELLRGGVAVLSSGEEPLEFRDGRPLEDPGVVLRNLPSLAGETMLTTGDRDAIHRTLAYVYSRPPRRSEEREGLRRLEAHLAAMPHIPDGARRALASYRTKPSRTSRGPPPDPTAPSIDGKLAGLPASSPSAPPSPVPSMKPPGPARAAVAPLMEAPSARLPAAPQPPSAQVNPPTRAVVAPAGPRIPKVPARARAAAKSATPHVAPAPRPAATSGPKAPPAEVLTRLEAATEASLEDGDYDAAMRAFDDHLKDFPGDASAWFGKGEVRSEEHTS